MTMPVHTVQVLDPQAGVDFLDRLTVGLRVGLAYATGTNPTVSVVFTDPLPQFYSVFATVTSGTGATGAVLVSSKTSTGFTVAVQGTVTVAGTIDVLVVG